VKLGGIVDSLVGFQCFQLLDLLVELGKGLFKFQDVAEDIGAAVAAGTRGRG